MLVNSEFYCNQVSGVKKVKSVKKPLKLKKAIGL